MEVLSPPSTIGGIAVASQWDEEQLRETHVQLAKALEYEHSLKCNFIDSASKLGFLTALQDSSIFTRIGIEQLGGDMQKRSSELAVHKEQELAVRKEQERLEGEVVQRLLMLHDLQARHQEASRRPEERRMEEEEAREAAAAQAGERGPRTELAERRLAEMRRWYEAVGRSVEVVAGMQVAAYADNSVTLRLHCNHTLTLFVDHDTALTDAKLLPATVGISDIVAEAVRRNRPEFLVREVRQRLAEHQA